MNNEIVKASDGPIHVSRLGVTFNGDVPEQVIDELMRNVGGAARGCLFIIGDAINYANDKYGDKYDRWMSLTGLEYQTLRNAGWIARKIELSRRRDNLTYEHHKLVASLVPDEQTRWLDMAEREGFSKRRLAKSLLFGRSATDEEMDAEKNDKGIENVHPYVNRICGFWGKLKESGWVKNAGVEKLRAFKRDLQPVVDIYNTLPD
jgi:hypothetical protein